MSGGAGLALSGFEPVVGWGALPPGVSFSGDATSVAVDDADNVWVFGRGTAPVIVLDSSGGFLKSWGSGDFDNPHAITIDGEGNVYLVDSGGHFIDKRSPDGKLLLRLGTRGTAAPRHSGVPFNMPTDIAVHPRTGELFVTDGYRNSAVHRFTADGRHLMSWGAPGSLPGEFSLPHGIAVVDDDIVAVCDRENFRIQLFTLSGEPVGQFHAHHPAAIVAVDSQIIVAELGPTLAQRDVPNLGNRVAVFDMSGRRIGAMGAANSGFNSDAFVAPHGIAVDSHGAVYVAEVARTWITQVLRKDAPEGEIPCLRKWRSVTEAG